MNNVPTKEVSSKQEKMIAKYLGWDTVVGSGARSFHPGDIISEDYLGECKTHMTKQSKIVFHRDFWDKIKNEAMSKFRTPVLFADDGTQTIENTYCVLPYFAIPAKYKSKFENMICSSVNIILTTNWQGTLAHNYEPVKGLYYKVKWGKEYVAVMSLPLFKLILDGDE